MIKFLHLSDTHWLADDRYNSANHRLQNYLFDYYPNHIILETGDITDDGEESQFDNVMEHQPGRWVFVPGNHDFGLAGLFYEEKRAQLFDTNLSAPFQGFHFAEKNDPLVRTVEEDGEKVRIIGLDSNLETVNPFDFAQGQIGNEQLFALRELLNNKEAGTRTIVMLHHHPFYHSDPTMKLIDSYQFLSVIYGKVDILLFGHRHVAGQWRNINGIPLVMAAPSSPRNDYVQEITIDGPNIWTRAIPWRKL